MCVVSVKDGGVLSNAMSHHASYGRPRIWKEEKIKLEHKQRALYDCLYKFQI